MTKLIGQSFASTTRDELLHVVPRHRLCQKAELCAAIQVCGSLVISEGSLCLRCTTENAALARKLYTDIKEATGERVSILTRENRKLHRRDTVMLDLCGRDIVLPFLSDLGIYEDGYLLRTLPDLYTRTCCKRSYLRGLFLACGSITSPDKAYHMEWMLHDAEMAQNVQTLLAELNIDALLSRRKQQYVIYLKDGESIAQTLAQIGAHNALFAMENARILHEVKNNVNRTVNCETANVAKIVNASMRQVQCIEYLAKTGRMATLPASLRQAADARLLNPQASLLELAQLMSPPATKSGMNHRLRRLVELAEQSGYIGE